MIKRPQLAHIAREDDVIEALRQQTASRGTQKAVAIDALLSPSHLSKIAHRKKAVTPRLAALLGFRLAWVRAEELDG